MSITFTPEARAALLKRPTVNVPQFAAVLDIGLGSAYAMVREGRVRSLRVGRRIVIPSSAIRELLGE